MPKSSNSLYFTASPIEEGGKLKRKPKEKKLIQKKQDTSSLVAKLLENKARKAAFYSRDLEISPWIEEARKRILDKSIIGSQIAKLEKDRLEKDRLEKETAQSVIDKQVRDAQLSLPAILGKSNTNKLEDLLDQQLAKFDKLTRMTAFTSKQQDDIYKALMELQDKDVANALMSQSTSQPQSANAAILPPSTMDISRSKTQANISKQKAARDILLEQRLTELIKETNVSDYKKAQQLYSSKYKERLYGREKMFNDIITTQFPSTSTTIQPTPSFDIVSDEDGSGLFSSIKDLAKKGIDKLVETVKEDPIGTAKQAFEAGKKLRELYVKRQGKEKEEKAGSLKIPKTHIKKIRKHIKDTYGGGIFDSIMKGFLTPFSIIKHVTSAVADAIPIPGVSDVLRGLGGIGDSISNVTGVDPLF